LNVPPVDVQRKKLIKLDRAKDWLSIIKKGNKSSFKRISL